MCPQNLYPMHYIYPLYTLVFSKMCKCYSLVRNQEKAGKGVRQDKSENGLSGDIGSDQYSSVNLI